MGEAGLVEALDRVEKIADVVRDGASESERLGHLSPPIVDALHAANLFRVFVPTEHGGLGLTIPDAVRVFERISALDASTGWTLTILNSGALFARFFPEQVLATVGRDPTGLVAGSLNPLTARAEPVDGGYLFSGRATYLSGSAHARWIMASALVMKDEAPVLADGAIQIRSGLFPIVQARSLDTWNVTGMCATGSTDYEFDGVMVASDWTFEPFGPRVVADGDVFSAIPLWAQLGGLAACAVGAARNMIDRFIELAATKVPTGNFSRLAERVPAQVAVGEAEGLYLAAHAALMASVEATWARGVAAEPFDNETLARYRLGSVTATLLAARAVDLLHDAAGMNAVARDTVLERCWRDMHTMTQHIILSPARFEIAGRVLMGLDPGSPVI
ncbi:MAG: indole-3-acetate monooxygenase [Actinomycetota bacterium]|nr:indole-3-acetate monooxygenase [Actinomycetota bacterium]